MRTRVSLRTKLKEYLRSKRRWVSKSELETVAKKLGFLAYTADRRLQEMTSYRPSAKYKHLVDLDIGKRDWKGQVHYRII